MSSLELESINNDQEQLEKRPEPTLPDVMLVSPGRARFGPTDSGGQPTDKYQLVFIILLLHGVGTLMPWNMFINAEDYFRNYKLRPHDANLTHLARDRSDQELEDMRKNFLPYLTLGSQLPNVLFNGLNLLVNLGSGNLKLRVNLTLTVEAIIFTLTIILVVVNSYAWPGFFFNVTMVSVILLNVASGIYQNCVFGIGAKFPDKYTNAILIGSNISGTFTSVVNLLSIWLAPQPQEAAMYYFITALLVILSCLISYNLLNLNPFFRFHDQADQQRKPKAELEIALIGSKKTQQPAQVQTNNGRSDIPETLRKTVDAMVPRPNDQRSEPDDNSFMGELNKKWLVFKKCWPQCMNVFFTFFFTLALFPSISVGIVPTGTLLDDKYFVPVACFLIFNVFALIGNLVSGWTTWPGKDHVWILVAARVLFVPFFLLCNFNPNIRQWPVLIKSDIAYALGNVLMALSSGYLSSLCMMFASSGLKQDEAPKAGMLAAFFLVFGIFMGITASFLLTWIVEVG